MLTDAQIATLCDIGQSIAFSDDRHGELFELIADGYVEKDGDLFKLTAKGEAAVVDRGAGLKRCDFGLTVIRFDTSGNPVSANNFIQAGYRLYEPKVPWVWSHTLYWRRSLR